jgi:hypothetical protein
MVVGVVLLVIGITSLIAQFTPELARYAPLALGFVLLAIFAATRSYIALVFGAIFSGVGGGLVAADLLAVTGEVEGGLVVLGLGLGFLGILVIGSIANLKENHWWPAIPGSILSLVGLGLLVNAFEEPLLGPIVLVGVGFVLIGLAYLRSRSPHAALLQRTCNDSEPESPDRSPIIQTPSTRARTGRARPAARR